MRGRSHVMMTSCRRLRGSVPPVTKREGENYEDFARRAAANPRPGLGTVGELSARARLPVVTLANRGGGIDGREAKL
jgi:hypothetical protein